MTIGETFNWNGRQVTVLDITRDDFTGEPIIVCLRIGNRPARWFWGAKVSEILQARAASLAGRTS